MRALGSLVMLVILMLAAACSEDDGIYLQYDAGVNTCENDGGDVDMADGYQMVGAVSPLPTAIYQEVECPDDVTEAAALDIRKVAQVVMTNDAILDKRIVELNPQTFDDVGDGGGPAQYETVTIDSVLPTFTTFTGASRDVGDVYVGNVVLVWVTGQVRMKQDGGVGIPQDYGHVALYVTDPVGGTAEYITGTTRQIDALGDPIHHVNFTMFARYVVQNSDGGSIRFEIRGAVEDDADEMVLKVHQIITQITSPT